MMVVSTNVCGRILIQINILGLNLYQHFTAVFKKVGTAQNRKHFTIRPEIRVKP